MHSGGGICCRGGNPLIYNAVVSYNQSEKGAGIYLETRSGAKFLNSQIYSNYSSSKGGGVYCLDSSPEFLNCLLFANQAADCCGAMYFGAFSEPFLSNVTVTVNRSNSIGGIGCFSSFPELINCIIYFNTTGDFDLDESKLDMGYHGPAKSINLVPSVKIQMNENYQPGDRVKITGVLSNPSLEVLTRPLVYMIKIGGEMFFIPGGQPVSNELQYEVISVMPGMHKRVILPEFAWPDTGESIDLDCWIYGGFLTSDLTEIEGIFTVNNWSYGPVE